AATAAREPELDRAAAHHRVRRDRGEEAHRRDRAGGPVRARASARRVGDLRRGQQREGGLVAVAIERRDLVEGISMSAAGARRGRRASRDVSIVRATAYPAPVPRTPGAASDPSRRATSTESVRLLSPLSLLATCMALAGSACLLHYQMIDVPRAGAQQA